LAANDRIKVRMSALQAAARAVRSNRTCRRRISRSNVAQLD
jgi:hypothetical protein